MYNLVLPGEDVSGSDWWNETPDEPWGGGGEYEYGAEYSDDDYYQPDGEPTLAEEEDYSSVEYIEFSENEGSVVIGDAPDTVFTEEEAGSIEFTWQERRDIGKRECKRGAIIAQKNKDQCTAAAAIAANHGATIMSDALNVCAIEQASVRATAEECAIDPPRSDIDKVLLATPILVARYAYHAQAHGGLPLDTIATASANAAMAFTAFRISMERFAAAKTGVKNPAHHPGVPLSTPSPRHFLATQLTAITNNAQVLDLQLRDLRNAILGVKGPVLTLDRTLRQARPNELANAIEASWRRALTRAEASYWVSKEILRKVDVEMKEKIKGVREGRITAAAIIQSAVQPIRSGFSTNAFKDLANIALEVAKDRRIRVTKGRARSVEGAGSREGRPIAASLKDQILGALSEVGGQKYLRFFSDRAAKKWPLRGSLKYAGVLLAYPP